MSPAGGGGFTYLCHARMGLSGIHVPFLDSRQKIAGMTDFIYPRHAVPRDTFHVSRCCDSLFTGNYLTLENDN
jgi:hypothetical protein